MWSNGVHTKRERLASGGRNVRGQSVRIIFRELITTSERVRGCVRIQRGQPSGQRLGGSERRRIERHVYELTGRVGCGKPRGDVERHDEHQRQLGHVHVVRVVVQSGTGVVDERRDRQPRDDV